MKTFVCFFRPLFYLIPLGAFVFLFLNSSRAAAESPDLRAIWLNHKAQLYLAAEQPEQALAQLIEALRSSPSTPELHLNMGKVFEALAEPEKALQSYKTAERLSDGPEIQFLARFNQGALLQKAKKVDEALKAYHGALEINPESRQTKINIELLISQQQQDEKKNQSGQGDKQQDSSGEGEQKDKENQKPQDKDDKDQQNKDQKKKDEPKQYGKNKPQPRQFKSEDLGQSDVNKILGELRNQEQRIRSEYNKREVKEQPRGKDW